MCIQYWNLHRVRVQSMLISIRQYTPVAYKLLFGKSKSQPKHAVDYSPVLIERIETCFHVARELCFLVRRMCDVAARHDFNDYRFRRFHVKAKSSSRMPPAAGRRTLFGDSPAVSQQRATFIDANRGIPQGLAQMR